MKPAITVLSDRLCHQGQDPSYDKGDNSLPSKSMYRKTLSRAFVPQLNLYCISQSWLVENNLIYLPLPCQRVIDGISNAAFNFNHKSGTDFIAYRNLQLQVV